MAEEADDVFAGSIDEKTGEAVYTPEPARLRNGLTDRTFAICQREGADVYAIVGVCL